MQSVTSSDGTRIAFWRSGEGPALLLVHGATSDHNTWRFVLPALEKRFTVYAMDRRGRGGSGDSPAYDLQREAEDVAAVVSAIDGPVSVFGHSFGGLCALEAALTIDMASLVLYECVGTRGADIYPPGFVERLEGKLAAGDAEGVVVGLLQELVQMPPEELELLRAQRDLWAARLENAPTIPRELRTDRSYVFDARRFSTHENTNPAHGWRRQPIKGDDERCCNCNGASECHGRHARRAATCSALHSARGAGG